jgi:hypothetical protein
LYKKPPSVTTRATVQIRKKLILKCKSTYNY